MQGFKFELSIYHGSLNICEKGRMIDLYFWPFMGPKIMIWTDEIPSGRLKMAMGSNFSHRYGVDLKKIMKNWEASVILPSKTAAYTWFFTCPFFHFFLNFGPLGYDPNHWKYTQVQPRLWTQIWAIAVDLS